MKHRVSFFLVCFTLAASISSATLAGEEEYNDCILKYLRGAKLDAAAALIRNACYENYGGIFTPSEKVRQYNECLLEHLVGVESFRAAMEIRNACGSKYLM